jgi:cyclophilin family peptidyl-prolyl cis-trans isomerase
MKIMFRLSAVVLSAFLAAGLASVRAEDKKNPVVVIETSLGNIDVELNAEKAPETVKNFLSYVKDKFYDGTVFHRVWDGFMIQGGGFTPDLKQKAMKDPIKNEADNGLKNVTGTIAMARLP